MAAKRKKTPAAKSMSAGEPPYLLTPRMRAVISCVLILHLIVVVAIPSSMPPPGSLAGQRIMRYAAPYAQAGNISHGYAFFAPNPGPGHLIRYELEFEDGDKLSGEFPNLKLQWPRLRYHRHFMLSEQLTGMLQTGFLQEPPPRPEDPRALPEYQRIMGNIARHQQLFRRRVASFARHLLSIYDAVNVEMRIVRHHIPGRKEFLDGRQLQDQSLYETLFTENFSKEQP